MKKILAFYLLFFVNTICLCAQNRDSLSQMAITYAAQNNIEALRDIYSKYRPQMPHHFALFCAAAIARSEGDYEKVTLYVDSLYKWYPKYLQKKTRLSLAEIKADALRKSGKYPELYEHCNKEIQYFTRYGFAKATLQNLYGYREKAEFLSKKNKNTLLLQYYDQKKIFELDSLFQKTGHTADELTQLRCKFLLSRAFHQPQLLLTTTQQMVEQYAQSLDDDELTACIVNHAERLILNGDWHALSVWIKKVEQLTVPHAAPMEHYKLWTKDFERYSQTTMTCTHSPSAIPTSYEWPLLLEGTVNRKSKIKFCMGTEQPYTLISESVAVPLQLHLLADTLSLPTDKGLLTVSPAIVGELSVGSMVCKNLFVYVVHSSNTLAAPFDNVLGLDFWLHFDKIYFHPEHLILEYRASAGKDSLEFQPNKNLFVSGQNGLQLLSPSSPKSHRLGIDCFYPNNILYQKAWESVGDEHSVPTLQIDGETYDINQPQSVDYKNSQNDGILGMPFLRMYQSVCLDFSTMKLSAKGHSTYTPQRNKFSYQTDRNYLARNAAALMAGEPKDSEEILFFQLLMAEGKNRPAEVISISEQLKKRQSDFYNVKIEAQALFQLGQYQSAAEAVRAALQSLTATTPEALQEKEELNFLLQVYQGFAHETAPKFSEKKHKITLQYKSDELPKLKIHRKKAEAYFDIFSPVTEIAERNVRKFRVKRLKTTTQFDYGIIPSLKFGELTLYNLPCRILKDEQEYEQKLPDKGKGIRLGWNALRLFRQVSFRKHEIILSTDTPEEMTGSAQLYYNGEWHVEATTHQGYRTFALTNETQENEIGEELTFAGISYPRSSRTPHTSSPGTVGTGKISFVYLKTLCNQLTFDFKDMKLKSK